MIGFQSTLQQDDEPAAAAAPAAPAAPPAAPAAPAAARDVDWILGTPVEGAEVEEADEALEPAV